MNKRNQTNCQEPAQKNHSFLQTFKRFFCPCLLPPHLSPIRNNNLSFRPLQSPQNSLRDSVPYETKEIQQGSSLKQKGTAWNKKGGLKGQLQMKRESLLDKASIKKDHSQILTREAPSVRRSLGNAKWDYSINSLTQKEIISVGVNDRHILVKIASIYLSPNPTALKKQLSQSRSQRKQEKNSNSDIDRYWVHRYALFQRFDQGIKLDQKSWGATPPGPVCEWIAGKCATAKLIVDAFTGIGGACIRMACGSSNSKKIIANDWNSKRLQCTLNNAKVYQVDKCIQLSENDFLSFQRAGVEVVYAQPPLGDIQTKSNSSLSIVDFQPTLDKIILKALALANNLILLLPAAISIDVLCSCINKCTTELQKMKDTCSAKVQKIYWQGELKYILVSMGRLVQEEIKLSHELDYIYNKLQGGSTFRHKKVIKFLREQYGMVFLLNLLKENQKKFKQKLKKPEEKPIETFLQLISDKKLIPKEKFQKIIHELDSPDKKRQSQVTNTINMTQEIPLEQMMQEEKVNEDMAYFRQSQQTQSEVSHYSYLSSLEKPLINSRQPRIFAQSYGSIIIKRTLNGSRDKRSISPNSPLGSPKTPTRRNRNKNSPKNRASQVTAQMQKVQRVPKDF